MIRVRLSDEDWALFGGPEWLTLDWDALAEMPWRQLDELERDMDMSMSEARVYALRKFARGFKAVLWLARMTSGDPALAIGWDEFDLIRPRKFLAEEVTAGGDTVPPDQSSPAATPGENASSRDSSKSSAAAEPSANSTPG